MIDQSFYLGIAFAVYLLLKADKKQINIFFQLSTDKITGIVFVSFTCWGFKLTGKGCKFIALIPPSK